MSVLINQVIFERLLQDKQELIPIINALSKKCNEECEKLKISKKCFTISVDSCSYSMNKIDLKFCGRLIFTVQKYIHMDYRVWLHNFRNGEPIPVFYYDETGICCVVTICKNMKDVCDLFEKFINNPEIKCIQNKINEEKEKNLNVGFGSNEDYSCVQSLMEFNSRLVEFNNKKV